MESKSSSLTMDNILLICSPMLCIFHSRASLHRLGWVAGKLLELAEELGVARDKVNGGGGRSW